MQWKSAAGLQKAPPPGATRLLFLARPLPIRRRAGRVFLTALILLSAGLGLVLLIFLPTGCSSKPRPADATGKAVDPPVLRIGWPAGVEPALLERFASSW